MRLELEIAFLNPLQINSGGDSLDTQIAKLNRLVMKLSEALALVKSSGDVLSKASAEITKLISDLKDTDPDISTEGQESVERISAIATALDSIVPDVSDPDAPAPEVTPVPEA